VVFVADGIQAIMQLLQRVVTYTSPVEAFATVNGSQAEVGGMFTLLNE